MVSAIAQRSTIGKSRALSGRSLVDLATPVLELIMEIKAGIITPSNDLRRKADELLKEMEQRGDAIGFRAKPLQDAKFALAAFVDETVLTADFPLRDEWEKHPLQLEYFGEHLAGVTYFERLNGLLGDLENNAEVLEIYYICLLIGYKGKYKIYLEDQLRGVIENIADHLRRVNRLRAGALSPHWKVTDQPEPQTVPKIPRWVKIGGSISVSLTVLIYLIFKFWLVADLNAAKEQLLR